MMSGSLKWIIFIASSIFIVFISRKSLVDLRAHGFYRFFAWEFILLLFVLNVEFWFEKPLALNQVLSWILLSASTYYVIAGYRLLRTRGRPTDLRSTEHLYKLEKTSYLVTEGIYGYIRHPMYGSLLLLAWGIFLKSVTGISFFLVTAASISLFLTAKVEERENLEFFGNTYENYLQHTKRFLPYIW